MAITVNTNIPSLVAQKCLNNASTKMNTAMERLSTGLRINSAKDDAAGSAVATKLDYKISSLAVAQDNAQMGTSMLQTTEGTLDVIQSNMQRIRDLTEQAANGTYGEDAMTAVKSEVAARLREITRMSNTAEFNGKKVLDGSCGDINLQVGIESNEDSIIKLDAEIFSSTAATKLIDISDDRTYNYNIKGNVYATTTTGKDLPIITEKATGDKYINYKDAHFYTRINNDYVEIEPADGATSTKTITTATGDEEITQIDWSKGFTIKMTDAAADSSYDGAAFVTDETILAKLKNTDPSKKDISMKLKDDEAVKLDASSTEKENKSIDDMLSWVYASDAFAQKFLDNIDSAISEVTARKTELGAAMQRVNSAVEVAQTMQTNLTDAVSLIKDADIAEESSNYVKNQILQQSAASLLATANQTPQIALQLI